MPQGIGETSWGDRAPPRPLPPRVARRGPRLAAATRKPAIGIARQPGRWDAAQIAEEKWLAPRVRPGWSPGVAAGCERPKRLLEPPQTTAKRDWFGPLLPDGIQCSASHRQCAVFVHVVRFWYQGIMELDSTGVGCACRRPARRRAECAARCRKEIEAQKTAASTGAGARR
jgi:hypothetical protein